MNNTFLKSTLILTIATLASKILGSIFRIPLQNIAGDEVLGIFSLVYPVYMVALTLSVAGIPVAISQLISQALVQKDSDRIHQIYRTATILTILFGVTSFTLIYSFSGPISSALGGPSTRLSLIVVAATLLVAPYMAVYRGYFQGFQDMRPTAISQVLEQFIRVGFILIIAYVLVQRNEASEIVSGGVMLASIIGALASAVYLLWTFKRSPLRPQSTTKFTFQHFKEMSKTILLLSLPICVGAITMALTNFVDSFTIPPSLRNAGFPEESINHTYGIYSRGLSLVQIATVFSSSIVLPLIPLITKTLAENKTKEASSIIEKTHRLTHLVSWPAAFGLFALTLPLNLALFTNLEGSAVLSVIGISAVFTSLSILGTGILQGMNKAKHAAYIIVAAVVVKVFMNMLFIKAFGLIGAGYSTLFVYIIIFAANTYFIWKSTRFTVWNRSITTMFVSSVVMGAVIGIPTLFFQMEAWGRTRALAYSTVAIIIGAGIYFALLLLTRTIKLEELAKLPIINKILNKNGNTASQQNRGKEARKLKKILWGLIIVSLLLSLPGIADRFQAEWKNRTYEMVMPFENVTDLVRRDPNLEEKEVLERLKAAGLQAVSIEPDSLKSLEAKGIVTTLNYEKLKEMSLFDSDFEQLIQDGPSDGLFVIFHEENEITDQIPSSFEHTEKITFKGRELVFVQGKEKKIKETPLGFSPRKIALIKDAGLPVILRVPNVDLSEEPFLFEQVLDLADDQTNRILFLGEDVIGFPQSNLIRSYAEQLKEQQYGAYAIEFDDQGGFHTLAYALDMNIIRLHSLGLEDIPSHLEGVERAVRAVKERNIRSLFIKMEEDKDPEATLEKTEKFMTDVQQSMPGLFHLGKAEPFEEIQIPTWSYLFTLLAAILFISIAVLTILQRTWLFYLSVLGLGAVSLLYLVTDKMMLIQGLALLVALAAPVFAILPINENRGILRSYGRAILISLIGIAIVIGILNGNEFLTKVDLFRGVILVYVFPIAFMFVYAIWGNIKPLLHSSVKYWHLAIIGVIGIVGLYYITRTGNEGSVSSIELTIRQYLENLLYVRPRTKEFLIGFPLYVLALYFIPINKKVAAILFIPGVIGFLSIVNTFTHLHIPIYVSLLRTAYSLVFGLVIGYIVIYLYKIGAKIYQNQIKPRWFS